MKSKIITNIAGQDIEIILKSGRLFEHICLTPGKSISVPEKVLTPTVLELFRRQLLHII